MTQTILLCLRLIWEFFKIGLFSIGGGLATIPFLSELGERSGWFTQADLANMIAISESTPGPIGINMATYVGYQTAGVVGCVLAPLGLVLPSFFIILLVIRILKRFRSSTLVNEAFSGLRPASVGLISAAGLSVIRITFWDAAAWAETGSLWSGVHWKSLLLAAVLVPLTLKLKCHPVWFLLASAVIGILFHFSV